MRLPYCLFSLFEPKPVLVYQIKHISLTLLLNVQFRHDYRHRMVCITVYVDGVGSYEDT